MSNKNLINVKIRVDGVKILYTFLNKDPNLPNSLPCELLKQLTNGILYKIKK